ncbi:MAG: uroporphyrinogen decarboxylase [Pseudomonadota bacterium]
MTIATGNTRLLKVLNGEPVDRTPVWIMRQAGRYLPEYLETRRRAGDFMTLASTPELACEVTLQPLHRFELDAAILFSDILTVPDAMGLGLYFEAGEGPKFKHPVRTPKAIAQLGTPDAETELRYVMDAVRLIRRELNGHVPLIGFSGSPWTVATYMIEGGGSKDYQHCKTLMYGEPAALHQLLQKVTTTTINYLKAQAEAGAQALMVFDTWGGILTPSAYTDYSLAYMQQIVDQLRESHPTIPITLFTKNAGARLTQLAATGCHGVGVDWTTDLEQARQLTGNRVALQGNMDPGVLYGSKRCITEEIQTILQSYGQGHRHIFNLGHGIHQHISPENVAHLIETLHALSPAFHRHRQNQSEKNATASVA